MRQGTSFKGLFRLECRDVLSQELKWAEEALNLIVDEGLHHILDTVLHGGSQVSPWYAGLKLDGAVAVGDTYAGLSANSLAWDEFEEYTGDRKEYLEGAAANRQITNSSSVAQFDITSSGSIYGALLCSVESRGTTTGTLLCAADIASYRTVDSGDQINVTYTITTSGE